MNRVDAKRYADLIKLLKKQTPPVTMSGVARYLGCCPSNVIMFVHNKSKSLRVAGGIADLTNSHATVRRICGLTIEQLPDPSINNAGVEPPAEQSAVKPAHSIPDPAVAAVAPSLDRSASILNDNSADNPPADESAPAPVEGSVTLHPFTSDAAHECNLACGRVVPCSTPDPDRIESAGLTEHPRQEPVCEGLDPAAAGQRDAAPDLISDLMIANYKPGEPDVQ